MKVVVLTVTASTFSLKNKHETQMENIYRAHAAFRVLSKTVNPTN